MRESETTARATLRRVGFGREDVAGDGRWSCVKIESMLRVCVSQREEENDLLADTHVDCFSATTFSR